MPVAIFFSCHSREGRNPGKNRKDLEDRKTVEKNWIPNQVWNDTEKKGNSWLEIGHSIPIYPNTKYPIMGFYLLLKYGI